MCTLQSNHFEHFRMLPRRQGLNPTPYARALHPLLVLTRVDNGRDLRRQESLNELLLGLLFLIEAELVRYERKIWRHQILIRIQQ